MPLIPKTQSTSWIDDSEEARLEDMKAEVVAARRAESSQRMQSRAVRNGIVSGAGAVLMWIVVGLLAIGLVASLGIWALLFRH